MRYTEIKNFENEEWRPVAGYEGLYFVSNYGRVKSRCKTSSNYTPIRENEHLLKPRMTKYGYLIVCLCKDGKKKDYAVHRLVGKAFIGVEAGMVLNHIDGCKTNNRASNLELVTYAENSKHAIRIGLKDGRSGGRPRRTISAIRDGQEVGTYQSIKSAGAALGLSSGGICNVLAGRVSTHKGYTFRYI